MDAEGSPNAEKGVKDLRRKFEDNEADIITELYARHFRPKDDHQISQTQRGSPNVGDKLDFDLAPNDSIGDQGFDFDLNDELDKKIQRDENKQ